MFNTESSDCPRRKRRAFGGGGKRGQAKREKKNERSRKDIFGTPSAESWVDFN